MDDNGNRDSGRHKPDPYRSVHAQWMMPQHHAMKDHPTAQTIKLMAIIAERDSAVHERDLALSEKKTALAERDMAIFQRDAVIAERNNAIVERNNAIQALEYAHCNGNFNGSSHAPHGSRNTNHHHHSAARSSSLESSHSPYDHEGEMLTNGTLPASTLSEGPKRRAEEEPKSEDDPSKKPSKSPTKKNRKEWKTEDLGGLNEVTFDESTMPVPVCSCTGKYQPCYKWGNGGWQSACCTTTLSVYPLPVMPNKRHARVNGRKMSGSVFNKLLSRLASEGHDLGVPIDLKDHWSKHGTNRYITIK